MSGKLTPKQAMFVKEYLVDLNATQAAIRAGYSAKTASEQGARLLGNVKIQAALGEVQQKRGNRLDVTADRIEKELAKIAFSHITDVIDWREITLESNEDEPNHSAAIACQSIRLKDSDTLSPEVTATIQEISQTAHGVKVKLYDKLKALELLGRRHGIFIDKVEHSGTIKNQNLSEAELDKRIAELTKKLS
ncbi:terminase small subunit [Endozoicomonas sp. SM1973]|uniref:Terminase small subunit n=1 Tax=Spartinivicinus marinus TaxID=2994442 RepID=A0A853IG66_9GAMM|nr:terminase small subunit [Spartinivicinus marinus]MCX4025065.1 terminase small subunit [Spartinivicinus marinus]NYZ68981.1 terminase small subunit [Spartinivicinus marinus]